MLSLDVKLVVPLVGRESRWFDIALVEDTILLGVEEEEERCN